MPSLPAKPERVKPRETLRREDRLRELRDERANDYEEENPDEPAALRNGEPRSNGGAENTAERHRDRVGVNDVAGPTEVEDRREISGEVDDFGRRRRGEKIETEHADEKKDEETTGAGSKKSVVKSESGADDDTEEPRFRRRMFRLVNEAEVLNEEDVDRDDDEKDKDDRFEESRVQE